MADNFLERRMEEYRARQAAGTLPRPQRAPEATAFVVDGLSAEGEKAVRSLRASGRYRVAFAGTDRRRGTALAQATGARFYPFDATTAEGRSRVLSDLERTWHRSAHLIIEPGQELPSEF